MNQTNNISQDKLYQGCNFSWLDVEYVGQQERVVGHSLDMFNDLETKSSFLRMPGETVEAARDRTRKGYCKYMPTTYHKETYR